MSGRSSRRVVDRLREPHCVIVMGVSGSGKTTVARGLAATLHWSFADGDDFHTPEYVARMARGVALTDRDRWPWLDRIADWISGQMADGVDVAVACSALRKAYRDRLRDRVPALFCLIDVSEEVAAGRLAARRLHFMSPSLLKSQLATLEPLSSDEPGFVVDGDGTREEVLAAAVQAWSNTVAERR